MAKVFITGSGGIGKSTVIKRLAERGFTAYDTDDMSGATELENLAGLPVAQPDGHVDWNKYRWNWQRPVIEELLASDETVFLGATPSNWKDFVNDFDVIIALTVDSKTHEHRLRTRHVPNHFAQGEQNISDNLYSQTKMLHELVAAGAIVVENNQSLDKVVDKILAKPDAKR